MDIIGTNFGKGYCIIKNLFSNTYRLGLTDTFGLDENTFVVNDKVRSVEIVTDDNKKDFISSAGWAFVGGLAFGGIGALAGLLAGGNKKRIVFNIIFDDGRQLMVSGKLKEYQDFLTICANNANKNEDDNNLNN